MQQIRCSTQVNFKSIEWNPGLKPGSGNLFYFLNREKCASVIRSRNGIRVRSPPGSGIFVFLKQLFSYSHEWLLLLVFLSSIIVSFKDDARWISDGGDAATISDSGDDGCAESVFGLVAVEGDDCGGEEWVWFVTCCVLPLLVSWVVVDRSCLARRLNIQLFLFLFFRWNLLLVLC